MKGFLKLMGFKYVETRQMVSLVVDILIAAEFSNDETTVIGSNGLYRYSINEAES